MEEGSPTNGVIPNCNFFYDKRVEGSTFTTNPTGVFEVYRAITGNEDCWLESTSIVCQSPKTLIICDWVLIDAGLEGLNNIINKLHSLLLGNGFPAFSIYLWQNGDLVALNPTLLLLLNKSPTILLEEISSRENLITSPCSTEIIKEKAANLGISADECLFLDKPILRQLDTPNDTAYIVAMSDLVESRFNIDDLLAYLKSLKIEIIFNQDTLSLKHRAFLNQHYQKLEKIGKILFDYQKIVIDDLALIETSKEISGEISYIDADFSNIKTLDINGRNINPVILNILLERASCVKTINLSSYTEINDHTVFDQPFLNHVENIYISSSNINASILKNIFLNAPNLKTFTMILSSISGEIDLSTLPENHLEYIHVLFNNTNPSLLNGMLSKAVNLKSLNLSLMGSTSAYHGINLHERSIRNLQSLFLSCVNTSTITLKEILHNSAKLKDLSLFYYTNIHDEDNDFNNISLNQLENLLLANCNISALALNNLLEKTPNLKYFTVTSSTNIYGHIDFSKLNNLENITVTYDDSIMLDLNSLLEKNSNLKTLSIASSRNIQNEVDLSGVSLNDLESLDVSNSNISTYTLKQILSKAPNLKLLNLSKCQNLHEDIDFSTLSLISLEAISVSGSNISISTLHSLLDSAPLLDKQATLNFLLYQHNSATITSSYRNQPQHNLSNYIEVPKHPDAPVYSDADTSYNPNTRLSVRRSILSVDDRHPEISLYRLKTYNFLIPNPNPTDMQHAFIQGNKDDLQLLPANDVDRISQDLLPLGKQLQTMYGEHFYLGSDRFILNNQWHPLPSLTPYDRISHITLDNDMDYELSYSHRDNCYYMRAQTDRHGVIAVNYLFTTPQIQNTTPLPEDIQQLIETFQDYGMGELTITAPNPTGETYLQAILTQKVGSCRIRASAFKAQMDRLYPQYPCRIIVNDCHSFVEVQIDDTWLPCDLGGYPVAEIDINEYLLIQDIEDYRELFKEKAPPNSDKASWIEDNLTNEFSKNLIQCPSEETLIDASAALYQAACDNKYPIFWVTSPNDLLCQNRFIVKNGDGTGDIHEGPGGPLYTFLMAHHDVQSAPVLMIDYTNFKSQDIVRFNSLLDDNRKADGIPVPKHFKIIGLQQKNHPEYYNGQDFLSRFDNKISYPFKKENTTPAPEDMDISSDDEPYVINLYHANNWQQRLEGRWTLHGSSLVWQEGELSKALASGRSIVIRNADETIKDYQLFWKKLQTDAIFAGYPVQMNNIHHEHGYDWISMSHDVSLNWLNNQQWQQILENGKDLPFLLNPSTFFTLFSQFNISDNDIKINPGFLEEAQGQELSMYLSRDLNIHQWAELFDEAHRYNIKLNIQCLPGITLKQDILTNLSIMDAQHDEDNIRPFSQENRSSLIVSDDSDVTANMLKTPDTTIIDISEYDINDLFFKLNGHFDATDKRFYFNESKRCVLNGLEQGQAFILKGTISAEKLDRLLPYLYQYPKLLTLILENKNLKIPGACQYHQPTLEETLVCLGDKQAYLRGDNSEYLFSAQELKSLSLSKLEAICTYQKSHPNNRDIHKPWDGLYEVRIHQDHVPQTSEDFIAKRLDEIKKTMQNAPLVFITGLTGVGKSTFITRELTKHFSVYENCDINKWASNPEGGILFIDEANISQRDYTEFEGLFQSPPFIIIDGEIITLSEHHKVICAGNPLSYGGSRSMPRLFEKHSNTVIFEPMSPNALFHQIIAPLFKNTPFELDAHELTKEVLEAYQFLLDKSSSALLITPRDIKAIIMRALAALDSTDLMENAQQHLQNCLHKQLRAILRTKVADFHINEFDERFPPITPPNICRLESYGNFIITESRRAAAECIDDTLNLRACRRNPHNHLSEDQLTGDLSAIILEGEPATGKTELVKAKLLAHHFTEGNINAPINQQQNMFYYLPISLSFEAKKRVLLKAFIEGNIVFIDEINSSPMVEQFINSLLMGQIPDDNIKDNFSESDLHNIKPGFTIIGTQNPIHMAGRQKSTRAENARRITFNLEPYNNQEMVQILTYYGLDKQRAEALIFAYHTERQQAINQQQDNIPTFREVLRALENIMKQDDQVTQNNNGENQYEIPYNTGSVATTQQTLFAINKKQQNVYTENDDDYEPDVPDDNSVHRL